MFSKVIPFFPKTSQPSNNVSIDEIYSFSSNNGVSWSSRTISGYSSTKFNSTTLVDLNNGYIVGDGGLLLVTNDGGLNWTKMQNPNSENVNHITKKPNGSIYMVGNNGVITKVK